MPVFVEPLIAPLQRRDERPAPHRGAEVVDIERLRRAERALDERRQFGRRLPENRQRFNRETLLAQGFDAPLRPRDILKDSDRKTPRFDLDVP